MKHSCILYTKGDENQGATRFFVTLFTRLLVACHSSLVNFFTHENR
jgi:hypothetical protein